MKLLKILSHEVTHLKHNEFLIPFISHILPPFFAVSSLSDKVVNPAAYAIINKISDEGALKIEQEGHGRIPKALHL